MNNRKRNREKNIYKYLITLVITIVIGIVGYYCPELINTQKTNEIVNNNIKYSENLNINEYKDKLKRYEHKFSYEDGHYKFVSTREI